MSDFDRWLGEQSYGTCARCGTKTADVQRRRMSTKYVDDESNFTIECDPCFEETEREWADMWSEYYGGCL